MDDANRDLRSIRTGRKLLYILGYADLRSAASAREEFYGLLPAPDLLVEVSADMALLSNRLRDRAETEGRTSRMEEKPKGSLGKAEAVLDAVREMSLFRWSGKTVCIINAGNMQALRERTAALADMIVPPAHPDRPRPLSEGRAY